jgi:hypothetical protein
MTEHGCDSEEFTISAWRTPEGATSEPSSEAVGGVTDRETTTSRWSLSTASTTDVSTSSSATTTVTDLPFEEDVPRRKKSTNVGAIAGGVVGGVVALGAIAFGLGFFLIRKRRNNKDNAAAAATGANQPFMGQGPAPGVEEYKPQQSQYGSPQPYQTTPATGYYQPQQEDKAWAQPHVGVTPTSPTPQYPGPASPGPVPAGVSEAGGNPVQQHPVQQRPLYEAP